MYSHLNSKRITIHNNATIYIGLYFIIVTTAGIQLVHLHTHVRFLFLGIYLTHQHTRVRVHSRDENYKNRI